jgi:tryptophan-rich sensory protein
MLRRDDLKVGMIVGFVAPIAGMLLYYLIQFRALTLREFFTVMFTQKSLLSGIVSISLIANAVIFTIYINSHRDKTAKGVFIATCIYVIASLLWRLIA